MRAHTYASRSAGGWLAPAASRRAPLLLARAHARGTGQRCRADAHEAASASIVRELDDDTRLAQLSASLAAVEAANQVDGETLEALRQQLAALRTGWAGKGATLREVVELVEALRGSEEDVTVLGAQVERAGGKVDQLRALLQEREAVMGALSARLAELEAPLRAREAAAVGAHAGEVAAMGAPAGEVAAGGGRSGSDGGQPQYARGAPPVSAPPRGDRYELELVPGLMLRLPGRPAGPRTAALAPAEAGVSVDGSAAAGMREGRSVGSLRVEAPGLAITAGLVLAVEMLVRSFAVFNEALPAASRPAANLMLALCVAALLWA